MNKKLKEKFDESVNAVLPITVIVLLLSIFVVPMETGTIALFLVGAFMLIIGMAFFQLGAETAMTPLGEGVGSSIMKTRKLPVLIGVCFLMGIIITLAEPDLQVLANQVPSIPNNTLIFTVALGVGVFLVIAVLRILFRISLPVLLCIFYIALFFLSFAAPADFIAVAFDSGGVTTGPMTVPFIMAIGVGLSATRNDKNGSSDSFGLISFCSVGPVLMVLLLGIFYHPTGAAYNETTIPDVITMQDVIREFVHMIPDYAKEVLLSILPVIFVFLIFQTLSQATGDQNDHRFTLHDHRSDPFLNRCKRRICSCWKSSWKQSCRPAVEMDFNPDRCLDRLLYRKSRACGPGIKPSG